MNSALGYLVCLRSQPAVVPLNSRPFTRWKDDNLGNRRIGMGASLHEVALTLLDEALSSPRSG